MRNLLALIATVAVAQAFHSKIPVTRSRTAGQGPTSTTSPYYRPGRTAPIDAVLYPVSGVDSLPVLQQQLQFVGTFAGLGVGTASLRAAFATAEGALPDGWFAKWRSTWPILGVVYVAAGAAHFAAADAFISIYPPQGTWGLWFLPGSAEFQVAWTGAAELAGGLGLLAGAAGSAFGGGKRWENLRSTAAGCLALLTVAVTPANFYMYSHGAIMVGAGPDGPVGIEFHAIRFIAQILLLGILTGIVTTPGTENGESSEPGKASNN